MIVREHVIFPTLSLMFTICLIKHSLFVVFTGSGAMIAIIVIGIIIILTFLLIVLKTYNRYGNIFM